MGDLLVLLTLWFMFHCVYMHYYYIVPQLLSIDLSCIYVKTTVIKYFIPALPSCFTQNKAVGAPLAVFCERYQDGSVYQKQIPILLYFYSQSQRLAISTVSAFSDQESRGIQNSSGRYRLLPVPTHTALPLCFFVLQRRFQ